MSTKYPRAHTDRLRLEFKEIRDELVATVLTILPEELDWAPRHDMKSYRAQLEEIAATEVETVNVMQGGPRDWDAAVASAGVKGPDAESVLEDLTRVRNETLAYLDTFSEEMLEKPIDLPVEWHGYYNGPQIEPEELFRWLIRHEYYHLGQIITMRWIQGHNPYN